MCVQPLYIWVYNNFSNEGASNTNKLLDNTIIRREKENTPKSCHVLEMTIIIDTNKYFIV